MLWCILFRLLLLWSVLRPNPLVLGVVEVLPLFIVVCFQEHNIIIFLCPLCFLT